MYVVFAPGGYKKYGRPIFFEFITIHDLTRHVIIEKKAKNLNYGP